VIHEIVTVAARIPALVSTLIQTNLASGADIAPIMKGKPNGTEAAKTLKELEGAMGRVQGWTGAYKQVISRLNSPLVAEESAPEQPSPPAAPNARKPRKASAPKADNPEGGSRFSMSTFIMEALAANPEGLTNKELTARVVEAAPAGKYSKPSSNVAVTLSGLKAKKQAQRGDNHRWTATS
jgi:hypothetical protein